MTNDRPIGFAPICPLCGASDHKIYDYNGTPMFACPKAPESSVVGFSLRPSPNERVWNGRVWADSAETDKGFCGLSPLETGEQDPYWRDGVCEQHDRRFVEGKKSTWVVTRDFVTGATKTMLRGAWAVAGYPWYLLIGGLGGAVRYALKKGKK